MLNTLGKFQNKKIKASLQEKVVYVRAAAILNMSCVILVLMKTSVSKRHPPQRVTEHSGGRDRSN